MNSQYINTNKYICKTNRLYQRQLKQSCLILLTNRNRKVAEEPVGKNRRNFNSRLLDKILFKQPVKINKRRNSIIFR
ncbi:hypothetical protein PJIAN_1704 [Paludibacter jiangxiensis]|uniref:Uncharacterized protein n=1 Tax=Paludibacter jiangxiensis TaxID=681398 RepID=A0A170YVY9_9BACT|nr:hypothetical protein PJIAN_1704 [Paludibacter jiangxiensis]